MCIAGSLKMLTQEDKADGQQSFFASTVSGYHHILTAFHIVGPDHVCDWFCENISVTTVTFALDLT